MGSVGSADKVPGYTESGYLEPLVARITVSSQHAGLF